MKTSIALISGMIVGAFVVANSPKLKKDVSEMTNTIMSKLEEIKKDLSDTVCKNTQDNMQQPKKPQPKAM